LDGVEKGYKWQNVMQHRGYDGEQQNKDDFHG